MKNKKDQQKQKIFDEVSKTLLFKNKFINLLENELKNTFNLLNVEPNYLINYDPKFINQRTINFDNCLNDELYSFNQFIELDLLKFNYYFNYSIYSGIIANWFKFNRDFLNNNINNNQFHYLTIHYKIRLEDYNQNFLLNLINNIIKIFNKCINEINKEINLKNINFFDLVKEEINLIKLKKLYPLLNTKDAYSEYLIDRKTNILYKDNTIFKNLFSLLKTNIILDNEGLLNIYYQNIDQIINFLNFYICPTNNELKEEFKYLPNEKNILSININLDILLLYILNLNEIKELYK